MCDISIIMEMFDSIIDSIWFLSLLFMIKGFFIMVSFKIKILFYWIKSELFILEYFINWKINFIDNGEKDNFRGK